MIYILKLDYSHQEQIFTIFPGSCINISLFIHRNAQIKQYAFENFKKDKSVIFKENTIKLSAMNFNFDPHENWVVICGGEYFRDSGILLVEYQIRDYIFTVRKKLYFGIV